MRGEDIHRAMAYLGKMKTSWQTPAVTIVSQMGRDPYKVLISCILSLRTQDRTTAEASSRLFLRADTPAAMAVLSKEEIAAAIYPVGFYQNKAATILEISRHILDDRNGTIPDIVEELLLFKGVGRKTANLVVTLGFGKPGICVDTHVHRICNRWGYVATRSPEETEMALRDRLPSEYWLTINDLLVAFGQNICRPVSPHCSICGISLLCDRVGVKKHR